MTVDFVPRSLVEQMLDEFPLDGFRSKPGEEPYFSVSQAKMLVRCPESYRRRYRKGEKARPALALMAGTADHDAVATDMRQHLETKKHWPAADVAAVFVNNFETKIEEIGGAGEIADWGETEESTGKLARLTGEDAKKAVGAAKDVGAGLVKTYMKDAAPNVEPITVEEPFTIDVGLAVPIHGYIDLKALRGSPDFAPERRVKRIIERKTTGKNSVSGEWQFQVSTYQLADPLPAEFQLSVKTKTPKVVVGEHIFEPPPPEVTIRQLRSAMVAVATYHALYGDDEPWPDGRMHTWACNICGWGPKGTNECFYWKGVS